MKSVSEDPQHFQSASVHFVLHRGTVVGVIALAQVRPQYADLPEIQQAMLPALAKEMAGSGGRVTTEIIYTEKLAVSKSASEVA